METETVEMVSDPRSPQILQDQQNPPNYGKIRETLDKLKNIGRESILSDRYERGDIEQNDNQKSTLNVIIVFAAISIFVLSYILMCVDMASDNYQTNLGTTITTLLLNIAVVVLLLILLVFKYQGILVGQYVYASITSVIFTLSFIYSIITIVYYTRTENKTNVHKARLAFSIIGTFFLSIFLFDGIRGLFGYDMYRRINYFLLFSIPLLLIIQSILSLVVAVNKNNDSSSSKPPIINIPPQTPPPPPSSTNPPSSTPPPTSTNPPSSTPPTSSGNNNGNTTTSINKNNANVDKTVTVKRGKISSQDRETKPTRPTVPTSPVKFNRSVDSQLEMALLKNQSKSLSK